jgi:hypothetical protein
MWNTSKWCGRVAGGAGALVVACLSLAAGGCSEKGDPNMATVTGVVTFKGQPLTKGAVGFAASGGESGSAVIDSQGRYEAKLRPGNYQATVQSEESAATMGDKGQMIPAKSAIPEKYGAIATSGLATTVQKGKNKFDINLTP